MKTIFHSWLTAAIMSVLAGSAFAQSAPAAPSPRSTHIDTMHERMSERHSKHLKALKAKLQLENGQVTAWSAFAQAMQPPAKPVPRPDRAALAILTTPERIDQMQAFKNQVDAQKQKRADASKAFYAELNADQKRPSMPKPHGTWPKPMSTPTPPPWARACPPVTPCPTETPCAAVPYVGQGPFRTFSFLTCINSPQRRSG